MLSRLIYSLKIHVRKGYLGYTLQTGHTPA